MEFYVKEEKELFQLAETLVKFADKRKKWLFYGEIGAGKTTFVKNLCRYLKIEDPVSSPTFSLVNEYTYRSLNTDTVGLIHHLDLYRLKSVEEALDIGIEDYLHDEDYCWIEWPEIIAPLLPEDCVEIKIEIVENSVRKIIFL